MKLSFNNRVILIIGVILTLNLINIILYNLNSNYKQFIFYTNPECRDQKGYNVKSYLNHVVRKRNSSRLLIPGEHLLTFDDMVYNSHTWLNRKITKDTKHRMMDLLQDMLTILERNNISFVMSQGMLLGSYFFHDLIPWDDDLDIFIDIKDINKLRAVFRQQSFQQMYGVHSFHEPDGINMYSKDKLDEDIPLDNLNSCGKGIDPKTKCYQVGKVYYFDSPKAGTQDWNYPFLDFFFIRNNGTHVYNFENWSAIAPIIIKTGDFYPFTLRPFNRFWIPTPRKPREFLKSHYKKFKCMEGLWDHQNERFMYLLQVFAQRVPCDMLLTCYSHVKRKPLYDKGKLINAKVVEELMLGGTSLQKMVLHEEFMVSDVLKFQTIQ